MLSCQFNHPLMVLFHIVLAVLPYSDKEVIIFAPGNAGTPSEHAIKAACQTPGPLQCLLAVPLLSWSVFSFISTAKISVTSLLLAFLLSRRKLSFADFGDLSLTLPVCP